MTQGASDHAAAALQCSRCRRGDSYAGRPPAIMINPSPAIISPWASDPSSPIQRVRSTNPNASASQSMAAAPSS
ncbi:MAG: hypothetical protein FWJ87_09165 [Micromonosporaceae bacterium]|jgi:hypothetical protein